MLFAATPSPSLSCSSAPDLCKNIYNWTGSAWLAESSYYLLVKPLRIMLIVLLAVLARYLIRRAINRLVRTKTSETKDAAARSRIPVALRAAAAGLTFERRRQRAEAIGSVLGSAASATIFAVTVMLILSELGIDLAPLLASAGIVGIAVGFGAQNLVKDFLAGLFMLLEDQYGVGDVVDVGEVSGVVDSVGLRVTTVRDQHGVIWYVRNGEIARVGNKSQGSAVVNVDVPIGFNPVERATSVIREAADALADDPEWADQLLERPEVLGVEQLTADGAVLRTTVHTLSDAQWRVARELRHRLSDAIERAGIAANLRSRRGVTASASGEAVTNGSHEPDDAAILRHEVADEPGTGGVLP